MELKDIKALADRKEELSHDEHVTLVNAIMDFGNPSSFYSEKQQKTVMFKELCGARVYLNIA